MNPNNIRKLPIKSIAFRIVGRTVYCTIYYWNPILQRECKSNACAKCHPDDKFDMKLGEHIAESRAKMKMFNEYKKLAFKIRREIRDKYNNLIEHELEHLNVLIHGGNTLS